MEGEGRRAGDGERSILKHSWGPTGAAKAQSWRPGRRAGDPAGLLCCRLENSRSPSSCCLMRRSRLGGPQPDSALTVGGSRRPGGPGACVLPLRPCGRASAPSWRQQPGGGVGGRSRHPSRFRAGASVGHGDSIPTPLLGLSFCLSLGFGSEGGTWLSLARPGRTGLISLCLLLGHEWYPSHLSGSDRRLLLCMLLPSQTLASPCANRKNSAIVVSETTKVSASRHPAMDPEVAWMLCFLA